MCASRKINQAESCYTCTGGVAPSPLHGKKKKKIIKAHDHILVSDAQNCLSSLCCRPVPWKVKLLNPDSLLNPRNPRTYLTKSTTQWKEARVPAVSGQVLLPSGTAHLGAFSVLCPEHENRVWEVWEAKCYAFAPSASTPQIPRNARSLALAFPLFQVCAVWFSRFIFYE